jgi:hypothetical protein
MGPLWNGVGGYALTTTKTNGCSVEGCRKVDAVQGKARRSQVSNRLSDCAIGAAAFIAVFWLAAPGPPPGSVGGCRLPRRARAVSSMRVDEGEGVSPAEDSRRQT